MDTVYSQNFKEIINDTPRQAARHNNRYVMPEHLLLSLLNNTEGEPSHLIERVSKGVSAYELREALDTALFNASTESEYSGTVNLNDVSISDLTGRIIKLSVLEARMLKSNLVDSTHLLLAIFHNSDAQNSEFMEPFHRAGVTYESLYRLMAANSNTAPRMGAEFTEDDDFEYPLAYGSVYDEDSDVWVLDVFPVDHAFLGNAVCNSAAVNSMLLFSLFCISSLTVTFTGTHTYWFPVVSSITKPSFQPFSVFQTAFPLLIALNPFGIIGF